MKNQDLLEKMQQKQSRLVKEFLTEKMRPCFASIDLQSRGTILIGPRGTGKTTLLLNEVKENKHSLYLSLDDLTIQNTNLLELVELAYDQGLKYLLLDEVHNRMNWSFEVKNIYDSFPKLKILLSDSSSLILRASNADLSRRFPKSKMPYLSFREYIYFKTEELLPIFDPLEKIKSDSEIKLPTEIENFRKKHNMNKLFADYLDQGQRPFLVEERYKERILNLIEKTIYADIPYFVPSIHKTHLATLKSIVSYLANSAIPTLNIQNLCNQWSIGKDKAYELIHVLESAGIIQIIYNTLTPKGSSKGDKIFFQDCSFYDALDGEKGNRQEAYFCSVLQSAGYKVITSDDEKKGDFEVNNLIFEIGGKNKSKKQADIVLREFQDDLYRNQWPLWVIGFMW